MCKSCKKLRFFISGVICVSTMWCWYCASSLQLYWKQASDRVEKNRCQCVFTLHDCSSKKESATVLNRRRKTIYLDKLEQWSLSRLILWVFFAGHHHNFRHLIWYWQNVNNYRTFLLWVRFTIGKWCKNAFVISGAMKKMHACQQFDVDIVSNQRHSSANVF